MRPTSVDTPLVEFPPINAVKWDLHPASGSLLISSLRALESLSYIIGIYVYNLLSILDYNSPEDKKLKILKLIWLFPSYKGFDGEDAQ